MIIYVIEGPSDPSLSPPGRQECVLVTAYSEPAMDTTDTPIRQPPALTPAERDLLSAAHDMVIEWFRDVHRLPFGRAVAQAIYVHNQLTPMTARDRDQFRRVANAIRLGDGDAETNPGPLVAILRAPLAD